jgi:hypothetical protein
MRVRDGVRIKNYPDPAGAVARTGPGDALEYYV